MKIVTVAALLAAGAALLSSAQAATIDLSFIGQQITPTGTTFAGTALGGLSGIDYDAANGRYVAISDDRSQLNAARYYTLSLALTPASFSGVTFNTTTSLKQPDGTPYPALSIDPESIRLSGGGKFLYTSEGENNPAAGRVVTPFVREANVDGSFVRELSTPAKYAPVANVATGIRNNLAFESLTISPDGSRIFTATENALQQDGPAAAVGVGSPSRILAFNASGNAVAEYVYNVEPVTVPPVPANAFATNGLVELLALSATQFIAVERAFSAGAPGTGNSIKLYLVDISGATDVLALDTLAGAAYAAASKTLLFDLDTLGIPLDNIEGIAFGQTLDNGKRSLILVSDNNFSGTQFTQFLAFQVDVPEPASALGLGAALIGLAAYRRRRLP